MTEVTLLDLFCGAGGLSHGFQQAGFKIACGVDSDEDSIRTFRMNHGECPGIVADLKSISSETIKDAMGLRHDVDCIVGGPPCQGFSKNRAFRHQNGQYIDDPRNHLYRQFFRFVEYFRPKIVLIENVPEILIKEQGNYKEAIYELFHGLHYSTNSMVINAAEYGVPQWRRRAFFLAGANNSSLKFPSPTHLLGPRPGKRTPKSANMISPKGKPLFANIPRGPVVWDAISDLYGKYAEDIDGESEYASRAQTEYQKERRENQRRVRNHFPWRLTERQVNRIKHLKEGQGQAHLPKELQTRNGYGSAYRRLQSDAQALTITTWMFHPGSGMFTHPYENRTITIREAARLQSFQDKFTFFGRYHSQCRQVGNAVAPLVAKNIAREILASLKIYNY